MHISRNGEITVRTIVLIILIVIAAAVIVTLMQRLVLGKAYPPVTGATIGIVLGAISLDIIRKRSA